MNIIETVKPINEDVDVDFRDMENIVLTEPATFTIYDNNTEHYDNAEPEITPQEVNSSLCDSGQTSSTEQRESSVPTELAQQEPLGNLNEITLQEPTSPQGPFMPYEKSNISGPAGPLDFSTDNAKLSQKTVTISPSTEQIILEYNNKDEVVNKFLLFEVAKQYYFQNIRTNNKFSNNIKLEFYKYYKQATFGNCYNPKPWFYEFKKRAKWQAWNSIRGMSILDASTAYIDLYNSIKK